MTYLLRDDFLALLKNHSGTTWTDDHPEDADGDEDYRIGTPSTILFVSTDAASCYDAYLAASAPELLADLLTAKKRIAILEAERRSLGHG